MAVDEERSRIRRFLAVWWPWLVLIAAAVPAVWHVVDFPEDLDPEFPTVERPTFNAMPPPAYRLAEPGDTIDRVSIYFGSAAVVLATMGLIRSRKGVGLWPAALAVAAAGLWHSATPGPTFDGWHGLGWRIVLDPAAPARLRLAVAAGAAGVVGIVLVNLLRRPGRPSPPPLRGRVGWGVSRAELPDTAGMDLPAPAVLVPRPPPTLPLPSRGEGIGDESASGGGKRPWMRSFGLLVAASVLVVARQFEVPGVEPVGYWPRWAFAWGLLAFDLAIIRALCARGLPGRWGGLGWASAVGAGWIGLTVAGVWLSWYHRPLDRLHAVVPGRIYISAMPTYLGLKIAHARHGFKTIINLFPEDMRDPLNPSRELRSPWLPQEERFVRENGIRYVRATADDNDSDEFLDRTLALARDPDAWPILVHCHGCMDRSPGWMGIYRFVVQGVPLDAILKEIEAHRGYRPKSSITLLFNRVLEPRAPERYRADPTAKRLIECAHGVKLIPYRAIISRAAREAAKR